MKTIITIFTGLFLACSTTAQTIMPNATKIIQRVDEQLSSKSRRAESTLIIYGKRFTRKMQSINYTQGTTHSFVEYIAPEREKGTKMLKLNKEMWIYSPSTDRTIMISGHLMRQSMMGSDLSYEDMMEDRKLSEMYSATYVKEELIDGRNCYVIDLKAILDDVAYPSQRIWVDTEYQVPLYQQLFAKSGKLLKEIKNRDIQQIGNRWFPMKINYKDMLKDGKGTDLIIQKIEFDINIPTSIFTKSSLKR